MRLIAADRVLAPDQDLTPGMVEIESGRITGVREGRSGRADIDGTGGILAPGLVDRSVRGQLPVRMQAAEVHDPAHPGVASGPAFTSAGLPGSR